MAEENNQMPSEAEAADELDPICIMGSNHGADGKKKGSPSPRAEIDTSAPFESVKEAASRFGGIGFWRPTSLKLHSQDGSEHYSEGVDLAKVEEQAAQLEKDLILKERETLDVLKELEMTKMIVEELKSKLHQEASKFDAALNANFNDNALKVKEKENQGQDATKQLSFDGLDRCPTSTPGLILLELKQAKVNLTRTTNDLAVIRATVESYNKKIEKERISLEKTRDRLSSNNSKISALEEEIDQTNKKLQQVKDGEAKSNSTDMLDITREIQRLSSEAEQFKRVGEAAKSQVMRVMSEIEQTKTKIKTAEIRLIAAKKMKEAARATEVAALAEIKALSNTNVLSAVQPNSESVTLSFEEYSSLTSKAREAEEACKGRVTEAVLQVDEANVSKTEILKKVEEATEEVKSSKKALEEALSRVEAANRGKMAVEEAMRKWRSEGQRRRSSVHSSTKFKNSCPSHQRKDGRLFDVNGLAIANEGLKPVLRPTLSIGQILSRKLLLTEELENGMQAERHITGKRKMSLGQMLGKPNGDLQSDHKSEVENGHKKQLPVKRKKFGFARITLLVTKQSKKKKKAMVTSSLTCRNL